MTDRWAFLRPWCRLLRGRLRLGGRVAEHSARWEYRWVAVRLPCALELASLDELQRLHEALDLLARVAHVDNAAYRALLVDECRVPRQDDDAPLDRELPARFRFVFNEKFLAPGALSPAEACERYFVDARQQPATEVYTEALSELLRVSGAVQTQSDGCESVDAASIQFDLQLEFVALPDEVLDMHLQGISEVLNALQVPPDAQVEESFLPLQLDAIRLDVGELTASWPLARRLASVLSPRLSFSEFAFSLKRTTAEQRSILRDSTGFFLRTALCSNDPAVGPEGGRGGIDALSIGFHGCDKWRFAAICSAISAASITRNLRLYGVFVSSDTPELRAWKWQWLAYALFSEAALSSISTVFIAAAQLTREDVVGMTQVLASNSPPMTAFEDRWPSAPAGLESGEQSEKYGYFQKDTPFALLDEEQHGNRFAESTIVLDKDSWLQILRNDYRHGIHLLVLVPGYGIARIDRSYASQIRRRRPTLSSSTSTTEKRQFHGLQSFILALGRREGDDGGDVLTDLLALIGATLRSLTIHSVGSYPVSLASIHRRCPRLAELFLDGVELVDADNLASTLDCRDSRIVRLGLVDAFSASHQVTQLAEAVGKPSSRLGQQLTELCLAGSELSCVFDETTIQALLAMLESNQKLTYFNLCAEPELHERYRGALRRHYGEVLPVEKEKLSMARKLALLSAARGRKAGTRAVNALDDRVLSLIFAFAATCATRAVSFHSDD